MALVCSLCNEVPEKPCVSTVSGNVFERRLIEKYISENGTDPINNQPLATEQLVDLQTSQVVKPKPPSATSIPATLKALQDEWDAVMLHSFTLRQQLHTTRQELSHALYQHDAACRVIARLTKEVTAAREALSSLKPQAGVTPTPSAAAAALTPGAQPSPATPTATAAAASQPAVAEPVGMSEDILTKLNDNAARLTADRKKRGKTVPEDLTSSEEIKQFTLKASHSGLHSASVAGILALDVWLEDHSRILTGGVDKTAVVFNRDSEQIVSVLKGQHTKKVTHVAYHTSSDVAFTASADSTIAMWGVPTATCGSVIRAHSGPVTGLSLHATGDYLLSCSEDKHWAFSDINSGQVISKVSESGDHALTSAQFHPDGLIFSVGTSDAMIKIWDLKDTSNNAVATFPGHSGPISAISFSENGYYLATAADDATVKLWDLRKLKNFKTIQLDSQYEVKSLGFDHSGTYLAVAGTDVRVYLCKQWSELLILGEHSSLATGVKFGKNASYLASTSMDRTLKFYANIA